MEYFRRCIDPASGVNTEAAISDVLTENGFMHFSDFDFAVYKKYSIYSTANDFFIYRPWGLQCSIEKQGYFNSERDHIRDSIMSSTEGGWLGNNRLNFVFIPLKNDG